MNRRLRVLVAGVSTPSATAGAGGGCHSIGGLPDPLCTPGVADPRVTQDNIHATICVAGYTITVRPPSSYTDALKQQQISQYGYWDTSLADYEEDHLIPLELGGHPTDRRTSGQNHVAVSTRPRKRMESKTHSTTRCAQD